jgi:phosphopantetheinyl transferase
MPLIHQHHINSDTKIGVWHITEPEIFFLQKVALQRAITHPHKRLQHLAGRYLLLNLFPTFPLELIQIADTRKPFLKDDAFHFSISHCGDYAAVIVSTNNRVGVDIEIPSQKIERIQHKFISGAERLVLDTLTLQDEIEKLTMAWSIKEAMFKWEGIGEIDFKKHMKIKNLYEVNDERMADCIFCKSDIVHLKVHSKTLEGNNLSWVIS